MRCKCGCMMIWHSDYISGIFVSWYTCPMCGHDTRDYHNYVQTTWSDHTEPLAESEE
jgi:hypothetical protein